MLRCRWECTYFPRFSWPSTVRISTEKMSSDAGRTWTRPLSSRASRRATVRRSDSPSAWPPSHDHERRCCARPSGRGRGGRFDRSRRGRHVVKRAGAQEDVLMRGHGGEHRLFVAFLLFVEGPVGLKGAAYLHCHPPRRAPCSAGIADHPWVFRVGRVEALQGGEAVSQFPVVFDKKAAGGEVQKDHGRPSAPPLPGRAKAAGRGACPGGSFSRSGGFKSTFSRATDSARPLVSGRRR